MCMRLREQMKIAVLVGGLRFDSQRRIVNGILEKAGRDGANVFVFTCDAWTYSSSYYNQGETAVFTLPDFSSYDGVILHGDTIYDNSVMKKVVKKIEEAKVPCVSLNIKYPGIYYMGMGNENGTYEIVKHFVEVHGAKNLAFISGPEGNQDAEGRLKGFCRALSDLGMSYDEKLIFYGDYHPGSGKDAVAYYDTLEGEFPDAIVAANDEMALGAYYELQERGYDVPGRVLLSGYDYAYKGRNHVPRITSVKRPELELGRGAYQKLMDIIAGREIAAEEELECTVMYSDSCGCVGKVAESENDFRKNMVREMMQITNYSEIIKSASADFTGVATFESLLEQIKKYLRMINPEEFYLCMCVVKEPVVGEMTGKMEEGTELAEFTRYSSEICIPLIWKNGNVERYGRFSVNELLPEEFMQGKTGEFYSIVPLHYQDRCYGYCVLGNSRLLIDSELFHLFIMNINNAFENLRKQNVLNRMVQKLNKMWIYDTLTGVHNRAGFFKFAYNLIAEARSKKHNLFALFLDLDGLKSVNDKYGHDEGDNFIKAMGQVMEKVRRHGELLMRYGGDEFVLLAHGFTQADAEEYIARIKTGIENYNAMSNRPYRLDASMGYTLMDPTDDFDLEELIESADREMYKVKNEKKRAKAEKEG